MDALFWVTDFDSELKGYFNTSSMPHGCIPIHIATIV